MNTPTFVVPDFYITTQEEFDNMTYRGNVTLVCQECQTVCKTQKKSILTAWKKSDRIAKFCSLKCSGLHYSKRSSKQVTCANCGKWFVKVFSSIKPNSNNFCTQSCSASFNNRNKKYGTRRSKLEMWLEVKLQQAYPGLTFIFNGKEAIGSELDIYIPSLKLAFELNGIFHFEPVFGKDKLDKTKRNDENKFQRCQEVGVSLCVIDTSAQKSFTEKSSLKYLNIIKEVLEIARKEVGG